MPDHEVHEIQLNGKQLVFMFMAATVVAVVIFLSGVMVGRGVRLPEADVLAASPDPVVDPIAPLDTQAAGASAKAAPVPRADLVPEPGPIAQENFTYDKHLGAPVAPAEPLKPAERRAEAVPREAEKPAASKVVATVENKGPVKAPAVEKPVGKPEPVTASKTFAEPPGNGWAAQVQTFGSVSDAEALAGRLKAKGYRTFVALNESGPPTARYRVRIGKYSTRSEAVAVGQKLQREERFEPWVTR
jgi:cell division septation protein DedD